MTPETPTPFRRVLIVGAGSGLSASLARICAEGGMTVALAARTIEKLAPLCAELGAYAFPCDAGDAGSVAGLFAAVDAAIGPPDVVIYNASGRLRGPIESLDPAAVARVLDVTAFGGFLVARQAAQRMVPRRHGVILFTGASASIKGYPNSAPFAMGKFALRGLAQSMARELAPQGIHVAHVVIDGGIASPTRPVAADSPDGLLDPGAIAQSYWHLMHQHRSAWTWEIELRPWVEKF
ncbi:SDR family NAD(P)-dependent oxidoreductase [Acidiphilium sp.]|uniref:SDR family NAD(P)-dependent oxidoreductase n=1 Tax=Acidiphilium sp. TaxID=527 RepID=UPI003D07AFE8